MEPIPSVILPRHGQGDAGSVAKLDLLDQR